MRSDFIGHQSRTALNRPSAEQCGLTTRPGAQIEPALVPPLDGSIGEHESDQLTALILDPGARLPHRTDPTGGLPRSERRHKDSDSRIAALGEWRPPPPSRGLRDHFIGIHRLSHNIGHLMYFPEYFNIFLRLSIL